MRALLLLLVRWLLTTLRPRGSLQLEVLALRHQISVYQRTCRRPRISPAERILWFFPGRNLGRLAPAPAVRETRYYHRLATHPLSRPLASPEPGWPTRTTSHRQGAPRAHSPPLPRQPDLGLASYRRGTGQARHRRCEVYRRALSHTPGHSALTKLEDVPG